jgi:hypothetical protein
MKEMQCQIIHLVATNTFVQVLEIALQNPFVIPCKQEVDIKKKEKIKQNKNHVALKY